MIDADEIYAGLKKKLADNVKTALTISGPKTLKVNRVWTDDNLDREDIESQLQAKLNGQSWAVPLYADLSLIDPQTGKEMSRSKKLRIMEIPKLTPRYSFIIDGEEFSIANQLRFKPGVYVKSRPEETSAHFKMPIGFSKFNHSMDYDPRGKRWTAYIDGKTIPLYSYLHSVGVSDNDIVGSVGLEALDKMKADSDLKKDVAKLATILTGEKADAQNLGENEVMIKDKLFSIPMLPDVPKLKYGKEYTKFESGLVVDALGNMSRVLSGEEDADIDSSRFKEFRTFDEILSERIEKATHGIQMRIRQRMRDKVAIRDIVQPDKIGNIVTSFFNRSQLSNYPSQSNPVNFLSGLTRTTVFGEGSLGNKRAVSKEDRDVDPSMFGTIDPMHTPEACHDEQTEVLTSSGWKFWREVTVGDRFACRINGRLEFREADRLFSSRYCGLMYEFKTPKTGYLVTPNHKIFYRPPWEGGKWRMEAADRVHERPIRVTSAHAALIGSGRNTFNLPFQPGGNATKREGSISIETWSAFMGWYLSEGSCRVDFAKKKYKIAITQYGESHKSNCREIAAVLEEMPFKWHRISGEDFVICRKELAVYLKQFGRSWEKFIPEDLLTASVLARRNLLDALLSGDGRVGGASRMKGHEGNPVRQKVYTTTSKRMAEGFDRLAISLGHTPITKIYRDSRGFRDVYEIRLLRRQEFSSLSHPRYNGSRKLFHVRKYDGMVYCATVPGHLLLTRRNGGTGIWSGNSDIGAVMHVTAGARKGEGTINATFLNPKTQKFVQVPHPEIYNKRIAFPNEYRREATGKMVPASKEIKAMHKGKIVTISPKEVDLVVDRPTDLFDFSTNMIPFLNAMHGGRGLMAAKMYDQAVALRDPEAPLVQSASERTKDPKKTFVRALGSLTATVAPMDGQVTKVSDTAITIEDSKGKSHAVQIYDNFPLNARSFMHSAPVVGVGAKIKKGDLLADSNFTRQGAMALGKNLRVAWIPYRGWGYEDGIIMSESAAEKLTSSHMYKIDHRDSPEGHTGREKFAAYFPAKYTKNQLEQLDDDGVVKVGTKVRPGDPLIVYLSKKQITPEDVVLGKISRNLVRPFGDASQKWDEPFEGEVVRVQKLPGGEVKVMLRTEEPLQIGDKVVSRYAAKGLVSRIMPDSEMPHTADGQPMEILLNPMGLISRMNPGQIYEALAGKIARKTGKTYVVDNFEPGDLRERLRSDLKKNGLSDTEELFDPVTGRSIGQVTMGDQFIMKLEHASKEKFNARDPSNAYTADLRPAKSGEGAQTIGHMEMSALMAHGALANIRDISTVKAGKNDEFWRALQMNEALPPPAPTFAFDKFISLLKGAGINVERRGTQFQLKPLVDDQTQAMSAGEISNSRMLLGKNLKPEDGGLFDDRITGGLTGRRWAHIQLPYEVPNPIFEPAIRGVLGLSQKKFDSIMEETQNVDQVGKTLDPTKGGMTGSPAIRRMLEAINVSKAVKELKTHAKKSEGSELNSINRAIRFLTNMKENQISIGDLFVSKVPVLPPIYRPVYPLADGTLNVSDVNYLYRDLIAIKNQVRDLHGQLPEDQYRNQRADMYQAVKAISGVGDPISSQNYRGIIDIVTGENPKCFDEKTEVLTEAGWVPFPLYDGKSRIGTVNLESDEFEFQEPTGFTARPYKGDMYRTLTRGVDLLVTPNHRHVVSTEFGYSKRNAIRKWKPFELTPMSNFGSWRRRRFMSAAGHYRGSMRRYNFLGVSVDAAPFAEFVGWWVAEGWVGNKHRGSGIVYIAQSNEATIPQIDECVERLGVPFRRDVYTKNRPKPVVYWAIHNKELAKWLLTNCGDGADNKQLSREVLSWPSEHLARLLRGYCLGDGSGGRRRSVKERKTYKRSPGKSFVCGTSSRQLVNDLQELGVKVGVRVVAHKYRHLYKIKGSGEIREAWYFGVIHYRDATVMADKTKVESYNGYVYGPTVPNGTVVVRRNGITSVSGNSSYFQSRVLRKQQELSGRAAIVGNPTLGIDEVGIPDDMAWVIFRPFIMQKLVEQGRAPLEADQLIQDRSPDAQDALARAMAERPVILNRAPTLHKHGILAMKPRMVPGKSIHLNQLVTVGFNADFDGDCYSGDVVLHDSNLQSVAVTHISNFPHNPKTGVRKGKNIEYGVPPNVLIPAFDGRTIKLMPVTKWSIHPDCEKWIVKTRRRRELIVSQDHSLYTLNPDTFECEKSKPAESIGRCAPVFNGGSVDAQEPSISKVDIDGDQSWKPRQRVEKSVALDAGFGWMVGAFVGDGWTSQRNGLFQIILSGESEEHPVIKRWVAELSRITDYPIGTSSHPHSFDGHACESAKAVNCCHGFGAWLRIQCGHLAENKRLPGFVLGSPVDFRRGLFCGLIDTDGTACWSKGSGTKKPQFALSFTTISNDLALGIRALGMALGIQSSVSTFRRREKDNFIVTFSAPQVKKALPWLSLESPRKQGALDRLASTDIGPNREDKVPFPERVRAEVTRLLASHTTATQKAGRDPFHSCVYTEVRKCSYGYITRFQARAILKILPVEACLSLPERWVDWVQDESISWDVIDSAVDTGEKMVMYDITVPNAWTFCTADGLVIQDTMGVHVPVSQDALEEAFNMMPSANPLSTSEKILVTPRHESQVGLYRLTQEGRKTDRTFANNAEATVAFDRGEITETDVIEVGGASTTVGRILVNRALPVNLRKPDIVMDKSTVTGILNTVARENPKALAPVVDTLKNIGNEYAYLSGFSVGLDDLALPQGQVDQVMKKYDRLAAQATRTVRNAKELDSRIVAIYGKAYDELKVVADKALRERGSSLSQMIRSGGRGDIAQATQIVAAPVLIEDIRGRIKPHPVRTGFAHGMTPVDYWVSNYGSRRGSVETKISTAEPGALTKSMVQTTIENRIVPGPTPDDERGLDFSVEDREGIGRFIMKDVPGVAKRGDLFDAQMREKLKQKNVKTVELGSPLTSSHPQGTYGLSYGLDERGQIPKPGAFIGIVASQSIGEPMTQLILGSKHVQGVTGRGAGTMTGFDKLKALLEMPQDVKNKAILAFESGTVRNVRKVPGGYDVHLGEKTIFTPFEPVVRAGKKVNPGDRISEGLIDPRDLLETRGVDAARSYMVDEIYDIFKGGVRKKHIETVVRSVTDRALVTDSGNRTDFIEGDIVPLNLVRTENRKQVIPVALNLAKNSMLMEDIAELGGIDKILTDEDITKLEGMGRTQVKANPNPIRYKPVFRGVEIAPFSRKDWMASLSYRRLKETLQKGVAEGWKSDVSGWNPVPGIAYGATIADPLKTPV